MIILRQKEFTGKNKRNNKMLKRGEEFIEGATHNPDLVINSPSYPAKLHARDQLEKTGFMPYADQKKFIEQYGSINSLSGRETKYLDNIKNKFPGIENSWENLEEIGERINVALPKTKNKATPKWTKDIKDTYSDFNWKNPAMINRGEYDNAVRVTRALRKSDSEYWNDYKKDLRSRAKEKLEQKKIAHEKEVLDSYYHHAEIASKLRTKANKPINRVIRSLKKKLR